MRLDRVIASQLSYSAYRVRCLLAQRQVTLNHNIVTDGSLPLTEFCHLQVAGQVLQNRQAVYLMFNKPKGCVSATRDNKNPTVLDFIQHPQKAELHLAGRLDFNTTGLVLLTNNGRWSRNITEPKSKVNKTYWVQTQAEITQDYIGAFAQGFYFAYENLWTQPAHLELLTSHTALIHLHEGRYHQIKRMFGRFNNEVVKLHRLSVGEIALDKKLETAAFRELTAEEVLNFMD